MIQFVAVLRRLAILGSQPRIAAEASWEGRRKATTDDGRRLEDIPEQRSTLELMLPSTAGAWR